jgi:RecB family exonuclease
VHALAALVKKEPDISAAMAIERLTNSWKIVDQNIGWYKDAQLEKASKMLERFFAWNEANPRELLAVEFKFMVEIGRAKLNGSVDRIEKDSEGALHVVDIKTGAGVVSGPEAEKHMQLMAYQLAVMQGGFAELDESRVSGGAELLMLAEEKKIPKAKTQSVLPPEPIIEVVTAAGEGMGASTFSAKINKNCRTCGVKSLCPVQPQGRSVID